jgi:hypothetical protein
MKSYPGYEELNSNILTDPDRFALPQSLVYQPTFYYDPMVSIVISLIINRDTTWSMLKDIITMSTI